MNVLRKQDTYRGINQVLKETVDCPKAIQLWTCQKTVIQSEKSIAE